MRSVVIMVSRVLSLLVQAVIKVLRALRDVAAIEIRAHELVVVLLAVARREAGFGARQQLADAGRQRLRPADAAAAGLLDATAGAERRRTAPVQQVVELRFDLARDGGAPLRAVLHQGHRDRHLDGASFLGRLALAHQVHHLAVRDGRQPVEFLEFARTQAQAFGQRGIETHRGHALQLGQRAAWAEQPRTVGVVAAGVLGAQQREQAGTQFFHLVGMQLLRHGLRIAAGHRIQERLRALLLGAAGARGPRGRVPRRPGAACKSGLYSKLWGPFRHSGLIGAGAIITSWAMRPHQL